MSLTNWIASTPALDGVVHRSLGRLSRSRRPSLITIITGGRTGSELLVDLLDSQPSVVCDGEIFEQPRHKLLPYLEGRALRRCGHGAGRSRAYGFKFLINHVQWYPDVYPDPAGMFAGLADRGLVIALWRENTVNQSLSFLKALDGGVFHHRDANTGYERFNVEPETLLGILYQADLQANWMRDVLSAVPHLDLTYERDLCSDADRQRTADDVMERLGLPAGPVATQLVAVAPQDALDRVGNADAVRRALAGTRWERFLD